MNNFVVRRSESWAAYYKRSLEIWQKLDYTLEAISKRTRQAKLIFLYNNVQ